jgi:hypothetical protein
VTGSDRADGVGPVPSRPRTAARQSARARSRRSRSSRITAMASSPEATHRGMARSSGLASDGSVESRISTPRSPVTSIRPG